MGSGWSGGDGERLGSRHQVRRVYCERRRHAFQTTDAELSIGEPLQWLIDIPDEQWSPFRFDFRMAEFRRGPGIHGSSAQQVLEPCLLREGEAESKVWTRWAKNGPLLPGVQVPPTNNDRRRTTTRAVGP